MPFSIEAAQSQDLPAMLALLKTCALPQIGLDAHLGTALVARADGQVVGTAALEVYEDKALLRSLAVATVHRGTGLGRRLTEAALMLARQYNVTHIYLLTTTAPGFFAYLGFRAITREEVIGTVRTSLEFTTLCPASAVVMMKSLA